MIELEKENKPLRIRKQASAENGVKIIKANQDKYSISAMCKTLRDLRIYKNKTKILGRFRSMEVA